MKVVGFPLLLRSSLTGVAKFCVEIIAVLPPAQRLLVGGPPYPKERTDNMLNNHHVTMVFRHKINYQLNRLKQVVRDVEKCLDTTIVGFNTDDWLCGIDGDGDLHFLFPDFENIPTTADGNLKRMMLALRTFRKLNADEIEKLCK